MNGTSLIMAWVFFLNCLLGFTTTVVQAQPTPQDQQLTPDRSADAEQIEPVTVFVPPLIDLSPRGNEVITERPMAAVDYEAKQLRRASQLAQENQREQMELRKASVALGQHQHQEARKASSELEMRVPGYAVDNAAVQLRQTEGVPKERSVSQQSGSADVPEASASGPVDQTAQDVLSVRQIQEQALAIRQKRKVLLELRSRADPADDATLRTIQAKQAELDEEARMLLHILNNRTAAASTP